jgi:large subunit ribosomal protein L29
MKQEEIAKLSTGDVKERLEDFNSQLNKLKLNHKISPLENPMVVRNTRKTVARLNTELSKRLKSAQA